MRDPILEQAIAAAGGTTALARRIGVSQPAISGWKRVPPERVLAVEAATGIARTRLRPDLYGEVTPDARDALDPVDAARADLYALIATVIWKAPDAGLLERLAAMPSDGSEVGRAIAGLAEAARGATVPALAREHFLLFTGVGGGDLFPYASYYLTGFMHERPLAEVRADLHRLGLVRAENVAEPEDHISFLCEMMAVLIRGHSAGGEAPSPRPWSAPRPKPSRGEGEDAAFFARHLAPWALGFFRDLEKAEAARFYRAVGTLGRILMELELAAFALPA